MIDPWNVVGTRLSQKLKKDENAPYPNLELTSAEIEAPTVLPCLFVNQLGAPQTSDDLSGRSQHAVISTIELQTFSAKNLVEARNIMSKAGDVMVSMGYSLFYGPEQRNIDTKKYRMVARFRRIVCEGDVL